MKNKGLYKGFRKPKPLPEPALRTHVLIGGETVEYWQHEVLTKAIWRGTLYVFASPEDMTKKIRWFKLAALRRGQQTLEL